MHSGWKLHCLPIFWTRLRIDCRSWVTSFVDWAGYSVDKPRQIPSCLEGKYGRSCILPVIYTVLKPAVKQRGSC